MHKLRRLVVLAALAAALTGLAVAPGSASAATSCPTFHVLHNDRIGDLQLPEGLYNVTATGLSCPQASSLFAQFLQDWDGNLPEPWRFTIQGVGRGTFIRGNGQTQFAVTLGSTPPTPPSPLACSFPFRVLHNDRIGQLRIPAGRYRLIRLGHSSPRCQAVSGLFAQFLQDYNGRLPNRWQLIPNEAAFIRGSLHYGFRIKRWAGDVPSSQRIYPTNELRCGATFRVLHNDRIGRLRLPRGPYWVNRLSRRLSCTTASQLFRMFLNRPAGNLPSNWVLNPGTGTFRRGRGSSYGFRVKAAFWIR